MAEDQRTLNIVILGASFAGLAVAHKLLEELSEHLLTSQTTLRYKVILVGPSKCLYWNIGAPRAIVNEKELPLDDVFVPFKPLFDDFSDERFQFIQGVASHVNLESRIVTVDEVYKGTPWLSQSQPNDSTIAVQRVPLHYLRFHALVCATGTSAESELLSLHGPHERTMGYLQSFHAQMHMAESIIIVGGGCSGVECAGQLATWLNRGKKLAKSASQPIQDLAKEEASGVRTKLHRKKSRDAGPGNSFDPERNKRTIILVSGHDRLLPKLQPKFGEQAEAKLKKLGVHVLHNYRWHSSIPEPSGRTKVMLSDDLSIICDVFIPATGVYPNTSYMPQEKLSPGRYIETDLRSLRVSGIVRRVFAVGDCAAHSRNSIQDVYNSIPAIVRNLMNDLLEHEIQTEFPDGGMTAQQKLDKLIDLQFNQNPTDSQLMPISRFGGVGILFGHKIPSVMVWLMKGRDYRKDRAKSAAGAGKDPYAVL